MESLNDRQKSYKLLEFNWYGISPMTFRLTVLERDIIHKSKETCFFNLFFWMNCPAFYIRSKSDIHSYSSK